MQEVKDLWPELGDIQQVRTPKAIMAEQAVFLNEKMKNVINAKVETTTAGSSKNDKFYQNFVLYSPALDNYSYELFYVIHGVTLYPLKAYFKSTYFESANEQEFVDSLKIIFSDPETLRVIYSLYSQSIE